MKKKYLERLQMNISNSYCKKHASLASYISAIYLIALITRLPSIFECLSKTRHSNVCLQFVCDAKLITPLFIF